MKIMITGGAGFIGSALVRRLLSSDEADIVNIDILTYAANKEALTEAQKNKRYKLCQFDICDSAKVRALIQQEKPDAMMHLAAESHVDRSIHGADPFINTNILGTYTLLKECHAAIESKSLPTHFRFLHVSTDEVYGALGFNDLPFTENTQYRPNSPYSASKASSDHLVRAWVKTYNFPALMTHCSNNYGPYQHTEKLIPLMISHCAQEKPLPVYGTGKNIRDWIYVDDHVDALLSVVKNGKLGEVYNIGGEHEVDNISLVKNICQLMDAKHPRKKGKHEELIQFVTDRKGHDLRYAISNDKIGYELSWKPKMGFDEGLSLTVDWYLQRMKK